MKISTPEIEGIYQGSKWLKFQVLCSSEELQDLFNQFEPFFLFPLSGIVNGEKLSKEMFLKEYGSSIEGLKNGGSPEDSFLRKMTCVCTDDEDALWLQEIPGKGYLTKIKKPVLQIQAHYFSYSKEDGVFRPMSMGQESIFWGLQFSYPSIYQDPKTMELHQAPKNRLFENVKQWIRNATRPTPFVVGEQKINSPIRLGKNCFSWIHSHPGLKNKEISIYVR